MDNQIVLNLEQVPKELSLILELIKDQQDESHQIDHEIFKDINWELFIDLSLHHRLYPILYSKAKQCNDVIPANVTKTLYHYYQRNTFQMLHLTREMETVSQLLDENQIRVLFLKGPHLAYELYGDLSLRTSSDLDFLIPIEALETVGNLLSELGYVKDDYIQTVLNDWRWRHHRVTYIHPENGLKLEVHWRLHPGPGIEPSFNDLWDRKSITSITSSPVYYLVKEDLFVFLVSHGSRHGWSRLRWLVDIHQLLKLDVNWEIVCKLFKKGKSLSVGGQSIVLATYLMNSHVHETLSPLLKGKQPIRLAQDAVFYLENMVNLHTTPVPERTARYHSRHLFSLMSLSQKLLFILSFLYPYPEDAQTLPLPKKLHFLYFPLRPFLWGWRKTRKHAIS
ncbi:nucleotidyltransferase domain-containing protein [Salipaludibacillus sp. CF4.18]|uniref:nucleotidyltransferase domain-containing protein n=1 Tax=Salipaludibacillus sp. CF4.18 TaxID=3373081 RepID=UPI003EE4E1D9